MNSNDDLHWRNRPKIFAVPISHSVRIMPQTKFWAYRALDRMNSPASIPVDAIIHGMDASKPHRRYNPLTGEWLLVSPQRATRPWLGAVEKAAQDRRPEYDPKCYLCPGNTRANGVTNPAYTGVYVFDNDVPALLNAADIAATSAEQAGATAPIFLRAEQETGVCRVICFSPRHDLTLAEMQVGGIRAVVDVWAEQCAELGAREDIQYVQLFENKGEIMGCSNPHLHGQLWATAHVPTEIAKETHNQRDYFDRHGSSLLIDYVEHELKDGARLLYQNDHFAVLVPFWAVWPFETMILPKQPLRRIVDASDEQRQSLADAIKALTAGYDRVFDTSFPYTMGVHQAPYDDQPHEGWQLHLHFYPPLLRSATVKKFMVGYEMLAQPQRDLTPEQAADRLRATMR
jgi:UDPglucose--hexose-1-phosphate uridylyltransferase